MHSKLLGTFKLPKFDGTPRAWKQWDRDFIRFLGLHQLEHVLLEGFLLLLPHPDAVAANKIVYFLVEEAVLPGTLASKYVRQAALWDGHVRHQTPPAGRHVFDWLNSLDMSCHVQ